MEERSLKENYGKRVREIRKSMKLTQEEFAERANLEYKYLGAIERGEKNLTISNIEKISKGFRIEAHQLFLFNFNGLKHREALIEEKIEDILKTCSKETKEVLLNIISWALELIKKTKK